MRTVPAVSLRRETDGDVEFLKSLYAASREREMVALVDWSDDQKRDFLAQQFNAQRSHYRKHYPDAQFDIIERSGLFHRSFVCRGTDARDPFDGHITHAGSTELRHWRQDLFRDYG